MKYSAKRLSHARLCEVLSYCPDTGIFVWKIRLSKRVRAGRQAGCLRQDGYIDINIDRESFLAHRLAWFYIHGVWPDDAIDHVNREKTDNRLSNLRQANFRQNSFNAKRPIRNRSGLKGVSWSRHAKKWRAQIRGVGHIGYFSDPLDAHNAYCVAARSIAGEFANFGIAEG